MDEYKIVLVDKPYSCLGKIFRSEYLIEWGRGP